MRRFASRQFLLMVLACCLAHFAVAQSTPVTSPEIEQRIQHVTSGLIGGLVLNNVNKVTYNFIERDAERV